MNKALFFAVILLALSVAQGQYAEKNFHKFPTIVYTSSESALKLKVHLNLKTSGSEELSLSGNRLDSGWIWSRKINSTDLSVISTSNFKYDNGELTLISGKYAIYFMFENATTLKVKQYDFEQNISLPSFLIAGKNASAKYPQFDTYLKDEEAYVSYSEPETLTLVRFKVGETEKRDTVVIPVKTGQAGIGMAKISANEMLVTLQPDRDTLQEILVDFEKGTYQVKQVSGFISGWSCRTYVTKKSYGSVCGAYYNSASGFHITRNFSAKLETLVIPCPNNTPIDAKVYGNYLVTIFAEYESEKVDHLYYELWDIETMSRVSGKVVFLEEYKVMWERFTFHQGDNGSVYVLLQHFNKGGWDLYNVEVKVGILLSGDSIEQNTTSEDDKLVQYFLA